MSSMASSFDERCITSGNSVQSAAMKRAVVVCAFFAILSCQQREGAAPPAAPAPAAKPFKAGLLTPGSINDGGWNAIAYEGLQRIKNELGAEISNQKTKTPPEFVEGFRSYGAKGFDIAVGHGVHAQEAARQ